MFIFFLLLLLLINSNNIYSFNLNITNIPFNIVGNIVTEKNEPETCKITTNIGLSKINLKFLCNSMIISSNYIIIPYTCIMNINNIFLLYDEILYDLDYIITDNTINYNYNNNILNSSNNYNNLVLIKLKKNINLPLIKDNNIIDNILFNSSLNDTNNYSDINKLLLINNNITTIEKKGTLFNLTYPVLNLNNIKNTNNINTMNNYYYYYNNQTNSNIKENILQINKVYNNFNNSILLTTLFNNLYLEYNILCIETQIYEYILNDNNIKLTICMPIIDVYNLYKLDISNNMSINYQRNKIKYTILPILQNNIYYFNYIQYDKNCRIINNNIFTSNSNIIVMSDIYILIILIYLNVIF